MPGESLYTIYFCVANSITTDEIYGICDNRAQYIQLLCSVSLFDAASDRRRANDLAMLADKMHATDQSELAVDGYGDVTSVMDDLTAGVLHLHTMGKIECCFD